MSGYEVKATDQQFQALQKAYASGSNEQVEGAWVAIFESWTYSEVEAFMNFLTDWLADEDDESS
jgi:hypothetical protein